jgi:hypothetical protein
MDGTLLRRGETAPDVRTTPTLRADVARQRERSPAPRSPLLSRAAALVLLVSVALTATLSIIANQLSQHTEHRLLDLQVKQTGTLLQVVLPTIETPLASAAEVSATTNGSARSFRSYISTYVGAQRQTFVMASLWRLDGGTAHLITTVGAPSVLAASPARASRTVVSAGKHPGVSVVGPLATSQVRPRLAYVYTTGPGSRYVVYAESLLPPHRRAQIQPGSPFGDLRFALYAGHSTRAGALLETNADTLPVAGDTARVTVPFGSSALTLVGASTVQLGGGLSGSLWWIIILAGAALTVIAVVTTERLVRGRRAAEQLTVQTETLLAEQRSIAKTLQRALLPDPFPPMPGLRAEGRYVAGALDVDIGGDWYDLLPLDEDRAFFVIGDVSGRGLRAGTTMAALRFAIHAFVSEGHSPEAVLDRLAKMVDVTRGGQFATILCGVLDAKKRQVSLASAGHLPPLVIGDHTSLYIEPPVGPPTGVTDQHSYRSVTVDVPRGGMILAFTDGLIERPGENIDVSLERLQALVGDASSLDEVFARLTPGDVSHGSDDIAILGVEWLA